jgi:hypothetical protein
MPTPPVEQALPHDVPGPQDLEDSVGRGGGDDIPGTSRGRSTSRSGTGSPKLSRTKQVEKALEEMRIWVSSLATRQNEMDEFMALCLTTEQAMAASDVELRKANISMRKCIELQAARLQKLGNADGLREKLNELSLLSEDKFDPVAQEGAGAQAQQGVDASQRAGEVQGDPYQLDGKQQAQMNLVNSRNGFMDGSGLEPGYGGRTRDVSDGYHGEQGGYVRNNRIREDFVIPETRVHYGLGDDKTTFTLNMGSASNDKINDNWVAKVVVSNDCFHGKMMMIVVDANLDPRYFNSINMMEGNLGTEHLEWCKTRPLVSHRDESVKCEFNRKVETYQKMDDRFKSSLPEFTLADQIDFGAYLDRCWVYVCRYSLDDHNFVKECLYDKLSTKVREVIGQPMRPTLEVNKCLTLKGYLCKLRDAFCPQNMRQINLSAFKVSRQEKKERIDVYFERKYYLFTLAYGPKPNDVDMHEFYSNFCSSLLSHELANQVRAVYSDQVANNTYKDVAVFKRLLLIRAQAIVDGVVAGQRPEHDKRGCQSYSYNLATSGQRLVREGKAQVIEINQFDDSDDYFISDDDGSSGNIENFDEIDSDTEHICAMQAQNASRAKVCWFCTKLGHFADKCRQKEAGKSPHPDGRIAKMRAARRPKKWGEKKVEQPGAPLQKTNLFKPGGGFNPRPVNQMSMDAKDENSASGVVDEIEEINEIGIEYTAGLDYLPFAF